MKGRTWTVAELVEELNSLLEASFSSVSVEGELTNVTRSARGHLYFSLKDESAAIDCVMWGSTAGRLKFEPEEGLAVRAAGAVKIYQQRGRLQLVVRSLVPEGVGALQLAYEQLKRRLEEEGLFAEERKRQMPALPQRIGIVTSPSGAALRDIVAVLTRHQRLQILVAGARVQGDGAAEEIASAIERLGSSGRVDLVVVSRGGGSLEDLWAFNEEATARAIATCPVPVISGVGHHVDYTIADFVADIRATTPTQAAELIVNHLEAQEDRLDVASFELRRATEQKVRLAHATLAGLEGSSGLARLPQRVALMRAMIERAVRLPDLIRRRFSRLAERLEASDRAVRRAPARFATETQRRLLETRCDQLAQLLAARMSRELGRIEHAEAGLNHLNPRRVLDRGYSITTVDGKPTPLRSVNEVRPGARLITQLSDGTVRSLVPGKSKSRRDSKKDNESGQQTLFGESAEGVASNGESHD
ncbi:MAG: exodeoxyribonuclease VII large subunit [bacterium]|nr:exodeoxyribonuclease VII large subunit [bacterium]